MTSKIFCRGKIEVSHTPSKERITISIEGEDAHITQRDLRELLSGLLDFLQPEESGS